MKKLLVYAHYYYPDVASTGQILTDLCEKLVDKYDVTVICTVPSYTGKINKKYKSKKIYFEEINGVHVVRVSVPEFDKKNKISRIKNIYAYYKNAIKATKKLGKFDLVYALSQPPILGGMLGRKGKKITGGKLIYNIQDFNPEQINAVKYSKSKLLTSALMSVDKKSCRESDLVITVGKDMQETLNNRFKNEEVPNNVVINNWIDEKSIYPLKKDNKKIIAFKKKYNLENKFIIMYSGNIGLYYDLENIIKIFKDYKDCKDVAFVFVGEGSIKNKLLEIKKEEKLTNVTFIPYQDKKDLNISLNVADVHLVTNAKGIKGVSVPSKIYGCLATNIPVFGILEKGSEAWNIIEKSKCGILSETGNYEEIKNNLDKVIKDKDKFTKKYSTGRQFLEKNYTKDKSIDKYKKEITKMESNQKENIFYFSDIIFYLATFMIPFENLWFAPSNGWATIAPIIFFVYLLFNLKNIIKKVNFKDIIPIVLVIVGLNVFGLLTNGFNIDRIKSSIITIALGITMYYSFKNYYLKHNSIKSIVRILLISYTISLLVGTIQWIAIRNNFTDIINFFTMFSKRSGYLLVGRVQYTFTEPSFISLHLFGVLLPLFLISKNKKIILLIFLFVILSFLYHCGLRIILDSVIVFIITMFSWILKQRNKIIKILLFLGILLIVVGGLYSTNYRFRKIVDNGIYADGSLASRYFRLEASGYGYLSDPLHFVTGYGIGNSIIPISQGYDKALNNYKSNYMKDVISLSDNNTTNDNATFCLFIRVISEFGFIVFVLLLVKIVIIYKKSNFKYKLPLLLTIFYLYIQFDSYAFYSIWLLLVILVLTCNGGKYVSKVNK